LYVESYYVNISYIHVSKNSSRDADLYTEDEIRNVYQLLADRIVHLKRKKLVYRENLNLLWLMNVKQLKQTVKENYFFSVTNC
jgi:hypothetical protein